jgi:hypothetical protein
MVVRSSLNTIAKRHKCAVYLLRHALRVEARSPRLSKGSSTSALRAVDQRAVDQTVAYPSLNPEP